MYSLFLSYSSFVRLIDLGRDPSLPTVSHHYSSEDHLTPRFSNEGFTSFQIFDEGCTIVTVSCCPLTLSSRITLCRRPRWASECYCTPSSPLKRSGGSPGFFTDFLFVSWISPEPQGSSHTLTTSLCLSFVCNRRLRWNLPASSD